MVKIPIVKQVEVRRALERAGFRAVHQTGSHVKMVRGDLSVTVQQHRGRDMPAGTLRAILEQAEMTIDEFNAWLKP
ncbi:MAG: type II toxin-antitoxin system HicA family toxin [Thermomicrobiales bacterium]